MPTLAHKKNPSSRPFPGSVKGKKNLARVKTPDTSQKNTVVPQIKQCPLNLNPHLSFTSLTTLSNYALQPSSSATFEFKTLARDEIGHTNGKGSGCDTEGCDLEGLGKSHACHGELQAQAQGSLEVNFLVNKDGAEIEIVAMDDHSVGNVNGDVKEDWMESEEGGGSLTSA